MNLNLKMMFSVGLVVFGSSAFAQAQAPAQYQMALDPKKPIKHIVVTVIFPGRTELYRGSKTAPFSSITNRSLPKKVQLSIPFLDIKNSDVDDGSSEATNDQSALYFQVKNTFDSVQQAVLRANDATSLYSSMIPRHDDDKDKEEITGYSYSRDALAGLVRVEESAIKDAMIAGLSDFESYFDTMLKPAGLMIDRDTIRILDSRKVDSTKVEVPGELDSVAGLLIKGDKIKDSDDYQWRFNTNQYTLKIEIPIKKSISNN